MHATWLRVRDQHDTSTNARIGDEGVAHRLVNSAGAVIGPARRDGASEPTKSGARLAPSCEVYRSGAREE
jgi:hypothetical protein